MYKICKQTQKAAKQTQHDIELLQVQARSCLYSVCSRYTNISLALCDPKVSGPVELLALDDSTACAAYGHRTPSDTDTESC